MGNLPSQIAEEEEIGDFELEKAVRYEAHCIEFIAYYNLLKVQKGEVNERGNWPVVTVLELKTTYLLSFFFLEENLFDFSILFNTEALHKAIVSIK